MTPKQKYAKGAEWLERVGLLTLGAFVIQQLIEGAPTLAVIVGFLVSLAIYGGAVFLLAKS